jgi:hypothetical protein
MVGHQAVSENAQIDFLDCFAEYRLERSVILILTKHPVATHTSVENVK